MTRGATGRVLFGVTVPNTALAFLDGQLGHLVDEGFDVHLVCPDTDDGRVAAMAARNGATHHLVAASRRPTPVQDLRTLREVSAVVRRTRPGVVVAGTPKMSLLLLTTSRLAGVGRRVYLCHGLRFEGYRGTRRRLLEGVERALCALATEVVAVSPSTRAGLVALGVDAARVVILGDGSPNGVDADRFRPADADERSAARARFGVTEERTIAFVGRLTHDKGIATLLACAEAMPEVAVLVAGDPEPGSREDAAVIRRLRELPSVRVLGRRPDVRPVYAAADVLVLPTVREGMPTVVLEAAACGLPTVAYEATGTVDAIADGSTGYLVPAGDVEGFISCLRHVLDDEDVRRALGARGRERVIERFAPARVWRLWSRLLSAGAADPP